MRSEVLPALGGSEIEITIAWNPLDSPTAKEYAEIRKIKAETDTLLAEAGVLEAIEIRHKIQSDPDSGYSHIDPDKEVGAGEGEGEADLDALNEPLAGGMDADEDTWMTLPNGAHILVDEDGEAKGGAGGVLNSGTNNPEKNTGRSRNSAPVSELDGNELGIKSGESIQDAAHRYYETLRKNPVEREGFGKVQFTGAGRHKLDSTSRPDPDRLKLLPAVKPMIEKGDYIGASPADKGRKDGIVKFHHFEGNVKIGDGTKFVGVSVGEDKHGNKFYNLTQDPDVLLEKKKARDLAWKKPGLRVPSGGTANDALEIIML